MGIVILIDRLTIILSLKKNYARTNVFKYSYFNRIVDSWNMLSKEIRMITNVNTFKLKVNNFLLNSN